MSIYVQSSDGNRVTFNLKPDVTMDRVLRAYAKRKDVEPSALRVTFEGQRVLPTDTVESLGLSDGEGLDVFQEQTGGAQ